MIEVFAKLDRGTVYLAGESIEGQVTFTNKGLFIFMIIVGTRQNAPHFIFTLFITDIDKVGRFWSSKDQVLSFGVVKIYKMIALNLFNLFLEHLMAQVKVLTALSFIKRTPFKNLRSLC